jgi:hypothetical protein
MIDWLYRGINNFFNFFLGRMTDGWNGYWLKGSKHVNTGTCTGKLVQSQYCPKNYSPSLKFPSEIPTVSVYHMWYKT